MRRSCRIDMMCSYTRWALESGIVCDSRMTGIWVDVFTIGSYIINRCVASRQGLS